MNTRAAKRGILASLFILSLAACGGSTDATKAPTEGQTSAPAIAIDELATYDARLLEIDACPNDFLGDTPGCGGANWAGDANIFVGDDRDLLLKIGKDLADSFTPSKKLPSKSYAYPGAATIDWETLLADAALKPNHVRFDWTAGSDPTAFPQSNSCVGAANVLNKMDVTAVAVSNNQTYAYFAVQRRDNDGDAGYMWLFTKEVPLQDDTACGGGQTLLSYRLTDGDVMFRGHFVPDTSEKLLFVYTIPTSPATITAGKSWVVDNTTYSAVCPASGPCYVDMPAKAAINWANGLWLEKSDGVAAAATNVSVAGAGSLGLLGVNATVANGASYTTKANNTAGIPAYQWQCTDPAGCMQPYIMAEVAVPVSVFTGGGVCGATFYGSVITRPSGNQPSPDMKDLAGPYQFNFGQAEVTIALSPSCDQKFGYRITSFTGLGVSTPSTCAWSYKTTAGSTWTQFDTACNTTEKFFSDAGLNGSYDVKVVAGDQLCSDDDTKSVNVFPPVDASATMTGSCTLSFTYDGTASGGSGSYTSGWTFSGPGTVTPSTSSVLDGSATVSAAGTYSGTLTVTDNRTDITGCNDTASPSALVNAPLQLTLGATPASLTCDPANPDTDIDPQGTFTATASGGSGNSANYVYHWTGCNSTSANLCYVSDTTTCEDKTLSVYVTDSSDSSCGNSPTKYGKYTKITTITTQTGNSAF